MSIRRCFAAKAKAGKVESRAAAKVLGWLDEAETEMAARMSVAEAARAAATETYDLAARMAAREADLALRSIEAQVNVLRSVSDYNADVAALREEGRAPLWYERGGLFLWRNEQRGSVTGPAIRALFNRDPAELARGANLAYLARDIRGRAHAKFADAVELMRNKMAGLKVETAIQNDVLAALFGRSDVPGEARAAAQAFGDVAEDLRKQFNAAGGDIPLRKNWRIPQPHDADKVASVARAAWTGFVRPLLDREDMIDFDTGKPMSDAKLDRLLADMHETIAARGLDGPPNMGGGGRAMLANRRSQARVLSFKSDEAWLAYRERFGVSETIFETMMGHIADMAQDIATLRVAGPNPAGLKRYVEGLFDREEAALRGSAGVDDAAAAAGNAKEISRRASKIRADKVATIRLIDEVTGAGNVPVNMEMARTMSDMRSWLVGAQMGSAILSSLTDAPLLAMTARLNGLPVMNVIRNATQMMAQKGAEIEGAQLGLVLDSLAMAGRENDRYMAETIRSGTASKVASAVIRASGLRRWTATLKNAFGMEMMAHVARLADRPLADVDGRFGEALARYGIDAADWDAIRAAPIYEPRPGARFVRAMDVAAAGTPEARRASEKLMRMINTEMDYAVIEGDPATRAMIYRGTRPGTPEGEAARAVGMYKQFPVTFVTLHLARAFARGWDGTRLSHAAFTTIAMWSFGILAMQSKQVANGKDPLTLDPTDPKGARAFGAGLLQSGGLGIFGDLLFIDQTRYGNSLLGTLAGPQFGAVESVSDFIQGNLGRLYKGEESHFTGDALYLAARYTPGSSLWYARQAFQRAIVDQLALMIDDRAPDRFRRAEREAQKSFGQDFWWAPGEAGPSRAPDLSAMGGL